MAGEKISISVSRSALEGSISKRGIGEYTRNVIESVKDSDSFELVEPNTSDFHIHTSFWDEFPQDSKFNVLVIHDLIPVLTSTYSKKNPAFNLVKGMIYKKRLNSRIKDADLIVCDSAATKESLHKLFEIESKVLPCPVDPFYLNDKPVCLGKKGSYLLYVGGIEDNKNLIRLLDSFKLLLEHETKGNKTYSNLKLMMPGSDFKGTSKQFSRLLKHIKEKELEEHVEFPGFVSKEQLKKLYSEALMLVYPSLIEGFGYPIIESHSAGTVVVTSKRPPMDEIGGDACIYVDPEDVMSIMRGMLLALRFNQDLYNVMVTRGYLNTTRFSRKTFSKNLLEILKKHRDRKNDQ